MKLDSTNYLLLQRQRFGKKYEVSSKYDDNVITV